MIAQLHHLASTNRWELFVPIPSEPADRWPAFAWPETHQDIPTPADRELALKDLGYAIKDVGPWEWTESATAPVTLQALTRVSPLP